MKNIIIAVIAIAIGFFTYKVLKEGASKKPDNAATQYADTLKKDREKAQDAADMAKLEVVRGAITSFNSAQNRLPSSLAELVEKGYLESVPSRMNYDPSTGQVSY